MLQPCCRSIGCLVRVQLSNSGENTGSWKLKSTFGCCRFEYIKMMHGDASLWESFPQALERRTGARRYVGAFRAPFQDLHLAPSQEHALRVCSLLAIPPPPRDPKALPGGVPENLSEDNLSTWADTVQDVATGMIVLQPGTDQIIFPHLVELLTLLESVSRVAFCRQCYLPGSACRCLETSFHRFDCIHYGTVVERSCRSNLRPQLGASWERRRIGASIWVFIHARRLRLGSAFHGLPRTPWGTFGYLPTPPPCWESFFSGKPAHGHTVQTDCAPRTFETSSADVDAPGHTEPSTDSAASASA